MASFQKRGKTWQYTISHKPKPIRKGGFNTKKEAQVAAAEVESKLQRGIVPHLKPEPFDEYFEQWLKVFKSDVGKNTLSRYQDTLKAIQEGFPGEYIQNITKRSYQAFLNEYGKTHAKDTTKRLNMHIRACVKDAIDEGIITVDFTRKAVLTGNKPSKRPEEKHLNYFDSKRLTRYLTDRLTTPTQYLILLALTSGARFGELIGLIREDFDFTNNTIRINKTWGYTKKMQVGFGPTKNEQSNRAIKMDELTMQIFQDWFSSTPDNILKLVFYSPTSKYKAISNGAANKALKSILDKLNIETISIHGMRHTHASILLYKKVSIYYLAERLGHKDTDTINKHYAHILKELREEDEASTVDIMESMAK